jgi:hypothetical protein
MAKPGADVQEGDIRPSSGVEAANDADVPWMWNRVNHTVVWGKRTFLSGEAFVIFLRKTLSPKGSARTASDPEPLPDSFAKMTGSSSKSYWKLSKTYATNAGMSNE